MPLETVPGTSLNYYLIAFDADGNERAEPDVLLSQQLLKVLSSEPITDVFLMSHGWMGDIPAARQQYNNWIGAMAANQDDLERIKQARPGFRPLLIGLHWPSKPWGDEELGGDAVSFDPTAPSPLEPLIAQYAERIADTPAAREALHTIFNAAMEDMAPSSLPPEVRQAYEVLNQEASLGSEGEGAAPESDREKFDPESIFQAAAAEPVEFGSLSFSGLLAPLRTLSFWKMKGFARQFGESSGHQLLHKLQEAAAATVRFHLIGHSFGCIVVSASLAGPKGHGTLLRPVHSVVLMQGALSLWSYSSDIPVAPGRAGYFHSVVADHKVTGPIVTTQSEFDNAVGKMYPLGAGIVLSDVNFGPGELPKYGGIGSFGIRGLGPEIVDLKMLPMHASYPFEAGKIYNLESSEFICDMSGGILAGAHSDIAKPEVAHAMWSAALTS
jgi:hypothetical protein